LEIAQGQSDCPSWNEVQVKRITASKCGRILCQHCKTDAVLKSVLYPRAMIHMPAAIKYGIKKLKTSQMGYAEHMKKQEHNGLVVEDCGFILSMNEG